MLDNSQIESFKKKGFLVIRNFFDSDFMNQILNEVNRLDDLEPLENGLMKYYEESQMNNNCLLYTSPSPRDGLLSRMPSSA